MRPLEGIKVVELATHVVVPVAARVMADWGAEVIKIESPKGDGWRYSGAGMGLPADENANVLDTNNMPIEGLYAAGDMTAGSIYGDTPANAGGTVYGSMTIGFVAGESAAAFVKGEN